MPRRGRRGKSERRLAVGLEWDAKKWVPVFRVNPALIFESITSYDFGLIQSKIIVIYAARGCW
jgi:hypothetical protein